MKRKIASTGSVVSRNLFAIVTCLGFCLSYPAHLKLTKLPVQGPGNYVIPVTRSLAPTSREAILYVAQGKEVLAYQNGALKPIYKASEPLSNFAVSTDNRFCTVLICRKDPKANEVIQKDLSTQKTRTWGMPNASTIEVSDDGRKVIVFINRGLKRDLKVIDTMTGKVALVPDTQLSERSWLELKGITGGYVAYGVLLNDSKLRSSKGGRPISIVHIDLNTCRVYLQKFLNNVSEIEDSYQYAFSSSGKFAIGFNRLAGNIDQWQMAVVNLEGTKNKYILNKLPQGWYPGGHPVIDDSGNGYWFTFPSTSNAKGPHALILNHAHFFSGQGARVTQTLIKDDLPKFTAKNPRYEVICSEALHLIKDGVVGCATLNKQNFFFNFKNPKLSFESTSVRRPMRYCWIDYSDNNGNVAGQYSLKNSSCLEDLNAFVENRFLGSEGGFRDLREYAGKTLGLGQQIHNIHFFKVCHISGKLQKITGVAFKGKDQYIFEIAQ